MENVQIENEKLREKNEKLLKFFDMMQDKDNRIVCDCHMSCHHSCFTSKCNKALLYVIEISTESKYKYRCCKDCLDHYRMKYDRATITIIEDFSEFLDKNNF